MTRDAAKARRAAQRPDRPGTNCKADPGAIVPKVDPRSCEGKADCIAVCPYDVFAMGQLSDEQFRAMPLLVKVRLWVHGKKTALTPNADACRACGLCVVACPEHAITLVERSLTPPAS